jgi:hypothetical protein
MSISAPATSLITWCAPSSLPVTTTPATRCRRPAAPLVGLGDQRVHPLEDALVTLEAGRPRSGGDDEDVRGEDALEDLRPLVAVALVVGEPGLTSKSATRISSVWTPAPLSASITTRASASVFDSAGEA